MEDLADGEEDSGTVDLDGEEEGTVEATGEEDTEEEDLEEGVEVDLVVEDIGAHSDSVEVGDTED